MNDHDRHKILERAAALRRLAHWPAPVTGIRTDVPALLADVHATWRVSTRAIADAHAAIERSLRVRQFTRALRQTIAQRPKAARE